MIKTIKTNAGPIEVTITLRTNRGYEIQNTSGHTARLARSRSGQTYYLMAGRERLTADELLRWVDGDSSVITNRLAEQRRQRQDRDEKRREAVARGIARAAELDVMAAQSGWMMIAGEESEVLHTGTRSECFAALQAALHRLPRDRHEGKGAWVLLPPDGSREMSGTFDEHCYY